MQKPDSDMSGAEVGVEPPEKPDGDMPAIADGNEPPEKPDEDWSEAGRGFDQSQIQEEPTIEFVLSRQDFRFGGISEIK